MVEVFAEAQRHGASLSTGTRELLRENLALLAAARDAPEVSAAFLRVLRGRGHIAETPARDAQARRPEDPVPGVRRTSSG